MIVFDLKCQCDHVFEVWFRSSADYVTQKSKGLITCPLCGSQAVEKAVMAPNVAAKSNQRSDQKQAVERPKATSVPAAPMPAATQKPQKVAHMSASDTGPTREQMTAFLRSLKTHVETTCDNVGHRFTEEARAIHYGDAEERGIYGNASAEDVEDLLDEGISVLPLLDPPKTDA